MSPRSLATIALTKEIFLVTDLADMKKVSSRITENAEDVAYLRREITVKSLRLCANVRDVKFYYCACFFDLRLSLIHI